MHSSCLNAEKKPSSANFDEAYGAKYGGDNLPENSSAKHETS